MQNFEFYAPTRMIFGKDTHKQVGKLVKEYGFKKVFVHYGGASAQKSGLLDTVLDALKAENIDYVTLGGVQANPTLAMAREGIELGKKEGVDFILAVGGGSVIDSAKCIADGIANPDTDVVIANNPRIHNFPPTRSKQIAKMNTHTRAIATQTKTQAKTASMTSNSGAPTGNARIARQATQKVPPFEDCFPEVPILSLFSSLM